MTLEHFRGRRLLLQRLPQLVEQPRVLDGDDGLGGKILHQFDLLVGKGARFLAVNIDSADQLVSLSIGTPMKARAPAELEGGTSMYLPRSGSDEIRNTFFVRISRPSGCFGLGAKAPAS